MAQGVKRVTARVFDRFPLAWDLNEVLQRGGIDSKIVTKHAVQIAPDDMDRAVAVFREEKARRVAGETESGAVA